MKKELNDVISEFHLYDEYVICEKGWEFINLEQIDTDMGKQMEEYEIKLFCSLDGTHWKGTFWNSYYDGVRDGYILNCYIPDVNEDELEDLEDLDVNMYDYITQLRLVVKELLDEIEDSTITRDDENYDHQCVDIEDIEDQIKKVKMILNNTQ